MLLLCLNIPHFKFYILFSKATTFNQHVMIKKYKNHERSNEIFLSYCSLKHSNMAQVLKDLV